MNANPFLLLAEKGVFDFLSAIPWWAWIPIVAIIFGGLGQCVVAWTKHRERMAMISMGMNPDAPEPRDGKPVYRESAEL